MQHAVKSSPVDVVEEYFWGKNCSLCARATGQGNHFEFISTVSVERQHSTSGPTCHDFPRFVIVSEKSRPEVGNRWLWSSQNGGFLGKKTPYGQIFINVFQSPNRGHRSTSLCADFVKFGWPEVGEIARRLMDKKKQKFGSPSHCRFCADRAQNLSRTAPNNSLGVPQISSKSVHLRRSYSRTREHRSNAPQSVCNTRRSLSFFAE